LLTKRTRVPGGTASSVGPTAPLEAIVMRYGFSGDGVIGPFPPPHAANTARMAPTIVRLGAWLTS
jgi:hypothetical protein